MSSIYNKADNEAVITRINRLTPDTLNIWGKMTVDQMLMHCCATIDVAFGEKDLKINFLMKLLGKMLKNKVFKNGFGQNSPTAPEFIFSGQYDFEKAKKDLITKFSRFSEGHSIIKTIKHPFWGNMTYTDWDTLMWKHLDHHLSQFGA